MSSRKRVKREPVEAVVPPPPTATMAPPSLDQQSAAGPAPSFVRSHAPSAETRRRFGLNSSLRPESSSHHHREGGGGGSGVGGSAGAGASTEPDTEPMFLEMRHHHQQIPNGNESPASQNADSSFAQHGSFAHPAFTDIGMKLKACNDTLGGLQQLGVSHVAALPELVLVGDQSAGKSSLMSGLAKVNLPRSAGVGTRCPLHIRLIGNCRDARWSCTVSLQQDYDFEPPRNSRIRVSDVTKSNPFPPWVKKSHREIKIFKTIFDPGEIEEVLRWAQVAVLNHNRNYEEFIPGEGAVAKDTPLAVAAGETDAQFSPNIVALEMKGPDLPDLSFYDLPGVFLSPDQEEDEYVVEVVKNLTEEYIRREKAIIMWALPMNADPENSITLKIIRRAQTTRRTIGIMTKADKLAPDDVDQWLAMFRGEKQSVGHGFFATSRPPDEPLDNAEKWEQLFFSREVGGGLWPAEFAEFSDRCGVDLLRDYITHRLADAFSAHLPDIKNKVHARLREIDQQLGDLPELPSNVEHEVKRSLHRFLFRMKTAVGDSGFASQWNELNSRFQDCILVSIKPTCMVKEPVTQTIDLSDDESAVTPSKRPRPSDSTIRGTPSKRARQDGTPTVAIKQESSSDQAHLGGTPAPGGGRNSPFPRSVMDIRKIRADIMKKTRPGMPPGLVPDEVRETLCLDAVKMWEAPLNMYIGKTAQLLEKMSSAVLDESLGALRQRMIFKDCQAYLGEFLGRAVAAQRARLGDLYQAETYRMFMMNKEAFTRYQAAELAELTRARAIERLRAVMLVPWEYRVKQSRDMTDQERAEEARLLVQEKARLGEDPYKTEIEVASFARGYYLTAATRFVEGVTMSVNSHLLRTVGETDLDMFMDEKLSILHNADASVYSHLMEEDEQTARLREQLKGEKATLSTAMASINELEVGHNGTDMDAGWESHHGIGHGALE